MNNSFIDQATEIEFLIPFHRQLTSDEAASVARKVVERKKDALLDWWKRKPTNEDWQGTKKQKRKNCSQQRPEIRVLFLFLENRSKTLLEKEIELCL